MEHRQSIISATCPKRPRTSTSKSVRMEHSSSQNVHATNATFNVLQNLQKRQKLCLYKSTFDPSSRGWRAPVPQKDSTSKWAKAKGAVVFLGIRRQQRKEQIDLASLVRATIRRHTLQVVDFGTRKMNGDGEDTFHAAPLIPKPFVNPMDKMHQAVWNSPNPLRRTSDISEQFSFHRPKAPDRESLSTAFMSHQAQYMKKVLAEKEKEMKLLQGQLNKFNAETYRLLKELEGYKGKNYDEIFEENEILKENIARVSKENTLLHGQLKQRSNRVLNKIAKKERYEQDGNIVFRRPMTTGSSRFK